MFRTYDDWKTTDPADLEPPTDAQKDEEARERLWWEFEVACKAFAAREGWPAAVRALGRAMAEQPTLFDRHD